MDALLGNLDLWGQATLNTVVLFLGGGALALALGTIVGAMRVSPVPIARAVGTVYVNLVRNTPLTLVFFFFVFGYPKLDLPEIPFMPLGIIALGIYTATYVAEVLRAGINTVPVGQAEAARAIGLSFGQVMTLVVVPQAFRSVVPPMMSVFIALLKNTTVAAGFSIAELAALRATVADSPNRPGTVMEILLWVAVVFVVLVTLLSLVQRHFEKKWRIVR
ncbi:amino acid ABC transporter permease [Microbacterium azadirachtae]|uniref:Inner membrane amino-acid ABC transporter permease protein YecS n=1 Tax=Microbacterium azadirachtae TaxID=582680 RepID=A0A0F0KZ35_9MICO|nr:ABC transporter permease subunit [Microbacterium azadirachtae]KJL26167.1 Inner membrane amino-acid ABC transporter permease protein YecS [Microbacterium azadirachtae]UXW87116.1 ABC transporter permease subunit [Microbacterium azadirachtae]SDM25188.1 glutamate transport system permease protein [Microbacterium azadirachtae]SEG49013.1 glutamate transport system permease protein [Microbacterium azadirachtae]SEG50914.1 glutamate transport system permease protein [Microbacterium azadirachtae]